MKHETPCYPQLISFECVPWPDAADTSYPPLSRFWLWPNAPEAVKDAFRGALKAAIEVGNGIFVADTVFWQAVREAQAVCGAAGYHVRRLSEH